MKEIRTKEARTTRKTKKIRRLEDKSVKGNKKAVLRTEKSDQRSLFSFAFPSRLLYNSKNYKFGRVWDDEGSEQNRSINN